MKTILVLSSHPDFAEAVRTSLNADQYRVVHRHNVDEGEPLLVHGLIGACILDADLMGVECVWIIERLRRRDAKTPIIAYHQSLPIRLGRRGLSARCHPDFDEARAAPTAQFHFRPPLEPVSRAGRSVQRPGRQYRHLHPRRRGSQTPPPVLPAPRKPSTCCAIFRQS